MPKPGSGDSRPANHARRKKATAKKEEARRDVEECVDDVLEDSFPASDPPPWTLGRKDPEKEPERDD
jgi:hypothetical protein